MDNSPHFLSNFRFFSQMIDGDWMTKIDFYPPSEMNEA